MLAVTRGKGMRESDPRLQAIHRLDLRQARPRRLYRRGECLLGRHVQAPAGRIIEATLHREHMLSGLHRSARFAEYHVVHAGEALLFCCEQKRGFQAF